MKYDLSDTITAAMMCHEPVIVVEGVDDIKFYNNIAKLNGLNIDTRAVETIDGYSEGCENVIKAMNDAQVLFNNDIRLKKYAIGIIDRDAREYRGTLPSIDNLLVLKYYSYESHLITDFTIKKLIEQLTKAHSILVTDNVVSFIKSEYAKQNEELYYFSLEALKKSCDDTYIADIQYGEKGGSLIGGLKAHKWNKIRPKRNDLDQFANSKSLSKADIKKIAKGKWYLLSWCEFLYIISGKLYQFCGSKLPQCSFCEAGMPGKCLWRANKGFQIATIENLLYTDSYIDLHEVQYIAEYMQYHLAQ
jgi:hypothetical protein